MRRHDVLDEEPEGNTPEELLQLVRAQSALLTEVATGGREIKLVEDQYVERRRRLRRGLLRSGLEDPFPYRSLWDWYGYWSGNLVGYASRRAFVIALAGPLIDTLQELADAAPVADFGGDGETWPSVDTKIAEMIEELAGAASVDDLQDVGRRCREITLAAANLVFDPSMLPAGAEAPGPNDAIARIEHYLSARISGPANARLRGLIKKQLDLAHQVTHDATVTRLQAFAAAQATVSIVRTLQESERLFRIAVSTSDL